MLNIIKENKLRILFVFLIVGVLTISIYISNKAKIEALKAYQSEVKVAIELKEDSLQKEKELREKKEAEIREAKRIEEETLAKEKLAREQEALEKERLSQEKKKTEKENSTVNNTEKNPQSEIKSATYFGGHVIVNKKYGLPRNFATREDPHAASMLKKLISEMQSLNYVVASDYAGFRTYEHQNRLYTNYVKNHGQAAADISSAKPGHSEHQTGLTFDLRSLSGALLTTEPEITWVRENAHRYGFIVRYPEGKTHITGYKYEPWHLRYLGNDATQVYQSGKTLEEYFNIP